MPVLLLKNGKPYRRPLTLAAVDPAHAHAKPALLDARILASAAELSKGLRGTLHIMHANYPSIAGCARAGGISRTLVDLEYRGAQGAGARGLRGVSRQRRHSAHPCSPRRRQSGRREIPRVATSSAPDIVVMGALSRSGLERVFIGNTAERVLGSLACDVLVVKPDKFAASVAQEARGLRVVAPTAALIS